MSTDGTSNDNADVLATNLFGTMTAGSNFVVPNVDLTQPEFNIPTDTDNALYTDVAKLTEADLTQRFVGGDGMFDGLMEAVDGHLDKQYKSNRLTGEQYASAYVQLSTAVLGNAVQYLLQKDSSHYQAQLAQKQAQMAEVGVVIERAKLETAKVGLATAQIEAESAKAQYALNKMNLANADIQYSLGQAQLTQTEYQTSALMPAQLADTQAGTALKTAQELKVDADTSLTGSQKLAVDKEVDIKAYQLQNMLPVETSALQADVAGKEYTNQFLLPKQLEAASMEISVNTARKDQLLYQNANILPAQKSELDADIAIKSYQLTDQLPAQTASVTTETIGKAYNNDFLLPAQYKNIQEQTEANRGKTSDTRLDGTTSIAGTTGKQKDLHQQQITSYQRDSEQKVVKMMLDAWSVSASTNDSVKAPTATENPQINSAVTQLRSNLGL